MIKTGKIVFCELLNLIKMEMIDMIKQMAWNTFKNTGDINTFLELIEVKNIEKNMIEAEKQNGNIEIKGNNNSGK